MEFNSLKSHLLEPDYKRPVYRLPDSVKNELMVKLTSLYGLEKAKEHFSELERIIKVYYSYKTKQLIEWEVKFDPQKRFSENDVVLITYSDLIRAEDQPPLETLAELSKKYLKGVINTLHILPFFPSSSDRGFAVKDFTEVDPALGDWEDIERLKDDFNLMFDGVFNHVSSKSHWFQEFINQNPEYINFFTVFSTSEKIPEDYLKLLVRPRTTDVLTPFDTLNGKKLVWTTFSPDQIDLNYRNPKVLIKMVEVLLYYIRRGADLVRLDAVTYLWDQLGTPGVHLKQTHTIIRLFRDVLNAVAPHVALITETNVPHEDNISYFGNGENEAQMVYNFALPPLVLHTFQTGNAAKLTDWAVSLQHISNTATYFNILDCHDGIGVMAVKNILSQEEIEMMALRVLEHGGFISYKKERDGSERPYEFNITWYSAINNEDSDEDVDFQVSRYIASRSIQLVMMGVPGIYLHGLLGSKNDAESVIEEEQTRSINRKTLSRNELIRSLLDPKTTTYKVVYHLVRLILKRKKEKAFAPNAYQKILKVSNEFFTVLRTSEDGKDYILAITNVTSKSQRFYLNLSTLKLSFTSWKDILTGSSVNVTKQVIDLMVEPYGILWFKNI